MEDFPVVFYLINHLLCFFQFVLLSRLLLKWNLLILLCIVKLVWVESHEIDFVKSKLHLGSFLTQLFVSFWENLPIWMNFIESFISKLLMVLIDKVLPWFPTIWSSNLSRGLLALSLKSSRIQLILKPKLNFQILLNRISLGYKSSLTWKSFHTLHRFKSNLSSQLPFKLIVSSYWLSSHLKVRVSFDWDSFFAVSYESLSSLWIQQILHLVYWDFLLVEDS